MHLESPEQLRWREGQKTYSGVCRRLGSLPEAGAQMHFQRGEDNKLSRGENAVSSSLTELYQDLFSFSFFSWDIVIYSR